MATRQITFDLDKRESIQLRSNSPRVVNGYIGEDGSLRRFPGYSLFYDAEENSHGSPITGVYSVNNTYNSGGVVQNSIGSDRTEILAVTCGREGSLMLFWYNGGRLVANVFYDPSYSLLNADVSKSNPVKFAFGRTVTYGYPEIIMADGNGPPLIYNLSDFKRISDPEAPDPCSHVVNIDTYLIGNNSGQQYFDISYPGDHTRWDGDFAQAVSSADDIMAIEKVRRKLILAGTDSIEIWRNDGSTPFSPEYSHIESGLSAKYSLINCDNVLYWLDKDRRVVACDIAQTVKPTIISTSLNASIEYATKQSFIQTYDCVGGQLSTDIGSFYVANFDNLERTYAVNTETGKWNEIGKWDKYRGEYRRYPLWTFWRSNTFGAIAGSSLDGKIYKISSKHNTFDGDEIRSTFRSNILRSAGSGRNIVKKLMVGVSRTADAPDSITIDPSILIRWRDDGATEWSMWREISITPTGRTEWDFELYRCGSYRNTRQYEVVMLGDYPYQISYIAEDV